MGVHPVLHILRVVRPFSPKLSSVWLARIRAGLCLANPIYGGYAHDTERDDGTDAGNDGEDGNSCEGE